MRNGLWKKLNTCPFFRDSFSSQAERFVLLVSRLCASRVERLSGRVTEKTGNVNSVVRDRSNIGFARTTSKRPPSLGQRSLVGTEILWVRSRRNRRRNARERGHATTSTGHQEMWERLCFSMLTFVSLNRVDHIVSAASFRSTLGTCRSDDCPSSLLAIALALCFRANTSRVYVQLTQYSCLVFFSTTARGAGCNPASNHSVEQ